MHKCMFICENIYYVYVYIYVLICLYGCAYMDICVYRSIYISIYIYGYVCAYTNICVHIYIYMYIHIYKRTEENTCCQANSTTRHSLGGAHQLVWWMTVVNFGGVLSPCAPLSVVTSGSSRHALRESQTDVLSMHTGGDILCICVYGAGH